MDINASSDRLEANLVFCLHRQFLNRSDIDHLSSWFVNLIKVILYKMTESLNGITYFYSFLGHKSVLTLFSTLAVIECLGLTNWDKETVIVYSVFSEPKVKLASSIWGLIQLIWMEKESCIMSGKLMQDSNSYISSQKRNHHCLSHNYNILYISCNKSFPTGKGYVGKLCFQNLQIMPSIFIRKRAEVYLVDVIDITQNELSAKGCVWTKSNF